MIVLNFIMPIIIGMMLYFIVVAAFVKCRSRPRAKNKETLTIQSGGGPSMTDSRSELKRSA